MLDLIENTDRALFLYLNGMHCSFCDAVMPYLTEFWVWIPLFCWWLFELYKKYQKKVVTVVLCTIALIILTDQGANMIKNSVKRYRPSHNVAIKDIVHTVNDHKGGVYGFISNHAANVFGVAFYIFFLLRPTRKIILISLFMWAAFIAYTRIYLGVHYPLDVLGGAIWGFISAFLVSKLCFKLL